MALGAAALLAPPLGPGKIGPEWFPATRGDAAALTAIVQQFLDAAVAEAAALLVPEVDRDAAATFGTYARAALAVYERLRANPSSMTKEGDGSQSYSWQQIESWKRDATEWQSKFLALVPVAAVATSSARTQSVANSVQF